MMTDKGRDTILDGLAYLYGAETAEATLPRVLERVRRHAGRIAVPGRTGWSEQDALLISYANQVRQPGETPLRTLADFCRRHLTGLLSGVHLLPFYLSSSDDGFSVVDYRQVDPACGTWDDIAGLGKCFRLMFDAVVNHVSSQSAWFRAFLRQQAPFSDYFVTPPAEAG